MTLSSFDIAIGGVLLLGLFGSLVAHQAGKAARGGAPADAQSLERRLEHIEEEVRSVRHAMSRTNR